jgi:hypothetical protein
MLASVSFEARSIGPARISKVEGAREFLKGLDEDAIASLVDKCTSAGLCKRAA